MNKETDLAWAAGFIDGEGCVSLIKRRNGDGYLYYQANLNVPQIDKAPLDKLKEMFGGNIRANKIIGNRRPSFTWTIHAASCRKALQEMLPYLIVKKKEALLLLSIDFDYTRLTDEKLMQRENVWAALRDHHKNFIFKVGG
jgi:hypothetical protein